MTDEMIEKELGRVAWQYLKHMTFDKNELILTSSAKALHEIQLVLLSADYSTSDFEIVEKIVCIFEKYGLDAGCCHDMG